ncbi:MAG TPA: DUF1287 domain-containing protein, partial [Polyangiaceae bacterium]
MKLARIATLAVTVLLVNRAVWCQARSKELQPTVASTAAHSGSETVQTPDIHPEPNQRSWIQQDRGVFPDLTSQIHIRQPQWLEAGPAVAIRVASHCYLYVDGVAVALCQKEQSPRFQVESLTDPDPDHDGIPSSLDILIGAKKTSLLKSPYRETYRKLPFPNGDLPRDEGVCSDVVVRALRNAGYDLQALVQADRALAPGAYPGIAKPDANIDHRRVRNLLVYFTRHFRALPVDSGGSTNAYLPGDILLFDTMGDPRPEHIGIVSDTWGPSGHPLIVNSWTNGYVTSEMDLLAFVPVTHR